MFTGIIETTGHIIDVIKNGSNKTFWITSSLTPELSIDQSLSHNGVCLTVEEMRDNQYRVTAVEETLKKTNLDSWNTGDIVNLERCLLLNGRLDGHLVQGHVDTTATCIQKNEKNGSWEFTFRFPAKFAPYIIEKGSVSMNGISLTAFNVAKKKFTVAVIPYTYTHTNMQNLKQGDEVNIEFDMVGKYVVKAQKLI
ncbi:MAG: riboflavin synthase [Chitinophagaceae bacterium]|jgi:riboflavin synthase|nr:riboflavin synthase [Chitinophagaceae bacterium]